MPNGCCHSESGKLIADQQLQHGVTAPPHDTYLTHNGHVASCSLLHSSAYCSSLRVRQPLCHLSTDSLCVLYLYSCPENS